MVVGGGGGGVSGSQLVDRHKNVTNTGSDPETLHNFIFLNVIIPYFEHNLIYFDCKFDCKSSTT